MASLTPTTMMDALSTLSPAHWCQIFFGLSTAAVLAIQVVPKTTQRLLLDYGARSPATTTDTDDRTKEPTGPNGLDFFTQAAKAVTSFGQIPHAWFMHFYVASVAGSAFWAWQYFQSGSVMAIISGQQAASGGPVVSFEHTVLVWALMALQGTRRLYECLFVMRPGSSRMCLKKYSLPEEGLFRYLICPHYTCECLIYLGLAMIAAPKGYMVNRTLMGALWFIVANLGTTADGTKQWYAQKFGAEKVASKWRMIPFVF
ncbi:3-oxo-5-alpha-steroid 4-dehydrogenase [Colletotrichum abscissum]|uniref:3-oxo-5-alpha-steroid 4-dehydrogenase n=1 Tax=Colletotrichum abscissum TaxID=1671311 RepID=UPI0027D4CB4F|nr:3-oxo-5-alpha-steroid 4-dehydrogenase [Colletotrichum abscissum]KAK1476226.1 3-oxo-5-alpha-steroid 4-dehydrogenase [Colletotrichum abscissum]